MKKLKSKHMGLALLLSLFTFSTFFTPIIQVSEMYDHNAGVFLKTSAAGVSNYAATQSVSYSVEINISVEQTSGMANWYFKTPRLIDRSLDSPYTQYCPPTQISDLTYNSISEPSTFVKDEFNNTYDLFNETLTDGGTTETLTLSQKYDITVNEITFGDIETLNIDMSDYNQSDPMFSLYCNNSVQYYNTSDPDLISLSTTIAGGYSNPAMKAKKIIEWVDTNIIYNDSEDMPAQELGASWAYDYRSGDCSEYSSLAVTLMRIQGIPARKVTGLIVTNEAGEMQMDFKPNVGYTKTYTIYGASSNFAGHAWMEYYIPTVGWVSCEPQNSNSWKTSSYLRFTQNNGQWFEFPLTPENISEYNMQFVVSGGGSYTYLHTFKYTVIAVNYITIDWVMIIIIVSIIGAVVVVSIIIIRSIVKRRRNKSDW